MLIGTTLSHPHLDFLKLDFKKSLVFLSKLELGIIRIGCYWSEIETKKDNFNFAKIQTILEYCSRKKQKVIVTVGMKAPRWPEFYLPSWINSSSQPDLFARCLNFIDKTVNKLKSYPCIYSWQVENEPLDPSGPDNKSIPLPFFLKEVNLVKTINPKIKVSANVWANECLKRKTIERLVPQVDAVGLDLYYKVPINSFFYLSFPFSEDKPANIIRNYEKDVWITELQAEPWEWQSIFYAGDNPRSISPSLMYRNFKKCLKANPSVVLFWGYEYWYWRMVKKKDSSYFKILSKIRQEIT